MENSSFLSKIKTEGISFFEAVSCSNETMYLILLTLYVTVFFLLKFSISSSAEEIEKVVRYSLLSIVVWGSAMYLFMVVATWKGLWKKNILLLLTGAIILFVAFFFSQHMSTNSYGVVMDIFFCVMVCGKNYKKILRCILGVAICMLIVAGVGMQLGFTLDMGKPNTPTPGHSFGINYPNTCGYLVFLGLIILWYLYLRYKPVLTFIVFWAVSAFMYFYITCRTIAAITIIFPFLAMFVDWFEKRVDREAEEGILKRKKPLEWLITVIPLLAFAFMMFSSMQVEWWHQFYHGPLRNLAWRFIQSGLYFRTYGLPIFGNPYRSNVYTYVNVNDEFIQVGILDSSFASYIIMRGLFWMAYTLLWLCVAHWKALKKRDYAIILIETIFLGFAMMERPGLEMWYNFVLLYPLAKVVNKVGTERVLEFGRKDDRGSDERLSEITTHADRSGSEENDEVENK